MPAQLALAAAESAAIRSPDRALRVYVTEAERAAIREKAEAENLSVSALARALMLGHPIRDRVAAARAIGELGRVGSNLNQLVRRVNAAAAAGHLAVDRPTLDQAVGLVEGLGDRIEAVSVAIEAARSGRPSEAKQ